MTKRPEMLPLLIVSALPLKTVGVGLPGVTGVVGVLGGEMGARGAVAEELRCTAVLAGSAVEAPSELSLL